MRGGRRSGHSLSLEGLPSANETSSSVKITPNLDVNLILQHSAICSTILMLLGSQSYRIDDHDVRGAQNCYQLSVETRAVPVTQAYREDRQ
jgi:hypothetical protein